MSAPPVSRNPSILTLPNELLHIAFQTLGPGDLFSLMLTTRHFTPTILALLSKHAYRDNLPPLHWASKTGDRRLASFILRNTDVDLTHRVSLKDVDETQYRLQGVNKLTEYGCTAFFLACWNGHEEVVRLILQHMDRELSPVQLMSSGLLIPECYETGDYPSCKIRSIATPLQAAASVGHTAVVALLLSCPGEEVDFVSYTGYVVSTMTPLQCAAQNGHLSCVQLLVSAGAVVDRGTRTYGLRALHFAAQYGRTEVVRFLLEQGAAVDGEPKVRSPLYYAVQNGYLETARVLLEAGADIHHKWPPGILSPLMVAQSEEMVDLLTNKNGG